MEWEGNDPSVDRVSVLKRNIETYDKNWQLMEIGAPVDHQIPLVFRKRKVSDHEK